MILAAKVGVTAFNVGRLAVNTKNTFGGLRDEIELWKVQVEYYTNYFQEVEPFIPHSMHTLALSRLKVFQAYIDRWLAKIAKAEAGNKKAKMLVIGKSSGEMGTPFAQDVAQMCASMDECIQFSQVHLTAARTHHMKAIDAQLQALGQPGLKLDHKKYLSDPLDVVVQSRRLIFLLEFPEEKVAVGSKVHLKWAIAGDIPHVKIELQVSSLMQQAQDKNKKKFILIADKVPCDHTGVGHHTWEIPLAHVATHGKHANYFFKLSYNPADNKASTSRFTSKVKGVTESFKIYDPSKKETKSAPTSAPTQSASTTSQSSASSEKSDSKGGVMGKASGLMGGIKKKF